MASDLSERAQRRLDELRRELMLGESRLQQLERETASVRQTTLRISGAIQVLIELLNHVPEMTPTTTPESEGADFTSASAI